MSAFEPLDIISLSRDDDPWPPLIVLVRDFQETPGWICINSKTAQIERVFDFIAYRYHKVGRAGVSNNLNLSINAFQRLLAKAAW